MKANGPKRKIFDAVDMMTADAPQTETGNGLQSLPVDRIKPFHDHPFHLYEGERLDDMWRASAYVKIGLKLFYAIILMAVNYPKVTV